MAEHLLIATVLDPGDEPHEAESEPVTLSCEDDGRPAGSLVLTDDQGRRLIFDLDEFEAALRAERRVERRAA